MKLLRKCLLLVMSTVTISSASAVQLHATASPETGAQWRFDFVLQNDSLVAPVENFSVYFSHLDFTKVFDGAGPAGWSLITIDPDAALPSDGFVDGQSLSDPDRIALGSSISFSARIVTNAVNATSFSPLRFELYDDAFNVIFTGVATVAVIPEPGTVALTLLGLPVLLTLKRLAQHRKA